MQDAETKATEEVTTDITDGGDDEYVIEPGQVNIDEDSKNQEPAPEEESPDSKDSESDDEQKPSDEEPQEKTVDTESDRTLTEDKQEEEKISEEETSPKPLRAPSSISLYEEDPADPSTDTTEDDLSDIAEADVALIERVLQAKGYVKKDELQETKAQLRKRTEQEMINTFISKHPEYSDENDSDGSKWQKLKDTFRLFDKSMRENPEHTLTLLENAHRLVAPESIQQKETIRKVAEQRRNRLGTQLSDGGGGSTSTESRTSGDELSPRAQKLAANLKGFDPETREKILKKIK